MPALRWVLEGSGEQSQAQVLLPQTLQLRRADSYSAKD